MTASRRGTPTGRWVLAPLVAAGVAVLAAAAFELPEAARLRATDRTFDDGLEVTGELDASWDGGAPLPVRYVDPASGDTVFVAVPVHDRSRMPDPGELLALEVDRDEPTRAVLAGDRETAHLPLTFFGPLVAALVLVAGLRAHRLRVSRRLAGADGGAYAMSGELVAPRGLARRWRLRLFPLDAAPDAEPVCVVPLVGAGVGAPRRFPVEVKGDPRPYGTVVARDPADGDLLWPAGRALAHLGAPTPRDPDVSVRRHRVLVYAGWALFFLAMVVLALVPEDRDDVADRADTTSATVVGPAGPDLVVVRFMQHGAPVSATVQLAGSPLPGDVAAIHVDPDHHGRAWGPTQAAPGASPTWTTVFAFALFGGIGLLAVGYIGGTRAKRRVPWPPPGAPAA